MIDKRLIAESFSKAAHSYDEAARLQRHAGQRLLEFLPADKKIETWLDLGCGTGYFTQELRQRHPEAQGIGLDLAEGMLAVARERCGDAVNWVQGDAESLPLASASVDLVFSSLAIQWCSHLEALLAELRRVLKPGGLLLVSTLTQGTLQELSEAWRAVDRYRHVNEFVTSDALRVASEAAGFQQSQWLPETLVLSYADLRELTSDLKKLGAHNLNADRPTGMTGRQRIQQLIAAYERFRRPDQGLPATWQLHYGILEN